jgi:hypothetical protein
MIRPFLKFDFCRAMHTAAALNEIDHIKLAYEDGAHHRAQTQGAAEAVEQRCIATNGGPTYIR